jgi:pyruvate dehydrogenase E2 component (dihydrolipoamide acetyltransferase)
MTNVILPSLGQTTTELEILRWFKQEGDAVREGEILLEVQTDKAVVELPATADGVLRNIAYQAGAMVEAGTVLAQIVVADAAVKSAPPPADSVTPASSPTLSESTTPQARVAALVNPPRTLQATPLARSIAREQNIDLTTVQGTGASGMIKRADVLEAVSAQPARAESSNETRRPLSPMRRAIARRMTESKQTIPHYYVTIHANVTALVQLRAALKRDLESAPSVNAFLLAAAAKALRAFPDMNASLDGDNHIVHDDINIGVAVQVPNGLLVPVLRNVDQFDLFRLDTALDNLIGRARAGRLTAGESSGAHFTISNMGMFGVDEFSAIINPPEAAILAVGRIRPAHVFEGASLVPGSEVSLTLTVDHRIIDGALAAQFLRALADELEHPLRAVRS